MIRDGSKVVVIDRKKKDWPGITFPGGHVEPGESFTDAVIREVKEETGLNICAPQLCGTKDWYGDGRRYVVLFYKASRFDGALRSSEEGSVWWEELEHLSILNLAPDMDDMIRVFQDDLSEFFCYPSGNGWSYALK